MNPNYFFHSYANKRKATNTITRLKDHIGTFQESAEGMEKIILNHFGSIFTSSNPSASDIDQALARLRLRVPPAMIQILEEPYTDSEIVKALKSMHPFKSPGPDGMSPVFYQKFWHIVGYDVVSFVLNFLNNNSTDHNINYTHIVLIPKVKNPELITQFRPISLCNVVYKLASKVLANRIRLVLPDIISESQSAFVPGRLITDNVLLAQEIHHHMKTKSPSSTGLMSIKLDMSKAFDRIEWIFVEKTMLSLGFPTPFVNLILKCISTVSFSFLLNGSEFGKLTPQRGIRQGDPLSPYLFIICSEVFSCLLQDLQRCRKIQGIAISRSAPPISHLFFADDTLIFGRATLEEARYLRFAIHLYERVSGQLVNQDKSCIYFSPDVQQEAAAAIRNILGYTQVTSHGKYLGLPSVVGRNKKEIFGFIKDRIWQRLQGWRNYNFSKAGKEILIKSVLQAIPAYAMSCFRFPDAVISDIQTMVTSFWWDNSNSRKKIRWTKWSIMTKSKSDGGLGFRHFKAFNLALLAKQGWRILSNPNSLLARVFKAKYHSQCDFLDAKLGYRPSWTWRSILESRPILQAGCLKKIHSGGNTKIWGDRWLPKPPFRITSPAPAHFNQAAKVHDLIDSDLNWWNIPLVHDLFTEDVAALILSIPLSLSLLEDQWYWYHSKNGKFSVKSAYHVAVTNIDMDAGHSDPGCSSSGPSPAWKKLWNLRVPARILHFMWRLLNDTLPVPHNLARRRIHVDSRCPLCNSSDTTTVHLFFKCPIATQTWKLAGLDAPILHFQQPSASLWARDFIQDSPTHVSEFFTVICNGIWYSRNKKIFDDHLPTPIAIVSSASSLLSSFHVANGWPERPFSALSEFALLKKAPPGTHIYFDGAISLSNKCAGIGLFIRKNDGSFLLGFSKSFPGIIDPEVAEALALREAILFATSMFLPDISFIGDSANIIAAANNLSTPSSACIPILADVEFLLSGISVFGLFWSPRTENIVAHEFAVYAKNSICTATSWQSPPEFLSQFVLDSFQQF